MSTVKIEDPKEKKSDDTPEVLQSFWSLVQDIYPSVLSPTNTLPFVPSRRSTDYKIP